MAKALRLDVQKNIAILPTIRRTMERSATGEGRERRPAGIGTVYHIAMGVLWTFMGVLVLGRDRFGLPLAVDPGLAALFGGACLVYGLFRLWRGYRGLKG